MNQNNPATSTVIDRKEILQILLTKIATVTQETLSLKFEITPSAPGRGRNNTTRISTISILVQPLNHMYHVDMGRLGTEAYTTRAPRQWPIDPTLLGEPEHRFERGSAGETISLQDLLESKWLHLGFSQV
jgi:hypothetical protein